MDAHPNAQNTAKKATTTPASVFRWSFSVPNWSKVRSAFILDAHPCLLGKGPVCHSLLARLTDYTVLTVSESQSHRLTVTVVVSVSAAVT